MTDTRLPQTRSVDVTSRQFLEWTATEEKRAIAERLARRAQVTGRQRPPVSKKSDLPGSGKKGEIS